MGRSAGVKEPLAGGLRLVQRYVVESGEELRVQRRGSTGDVGLGVVAGGLGPRTPAVGARGAWNGHAWTMPVQGFMEGQKTGGGAWEEGAPFFFFFLALEEDWNERPPEAGATGNVAGCFPAPVPCDGCAFGAAWVTNAAAA